MSLPTTFEILCAIARAEIENDPRIDDGEWADRIKRRLTRQRYRMPKPHDITAAMRTVERALAQSWGPRPAPVRVESNELEASRPPIAAPPTHAESVAMLKRLGATIKSMPTVRRMTQREADKRQALRIVAEGIREQVQRCEDAERAVEEDKP